MKPNYFKAHLWKLKPNYFRVHWWKLKPNYFKKRCQEKTSFPQEHTPSSRRIKPSLSAWVHLEHMSVFPSISSAYTIAPSLSSWAHEYTVKSWRLKASLIHPFRVRPCALLVSLSTWSHLEGLKDFYSSFVSAYALDGLSLFPEHISAPQSLKWPLNFLHALIVFPPCLHANFLHVWVFMSRRW